MSEANENRSRTAGGEDPGVLANLPRSRPQRASPRRAAARRAAAKKTSGGADANGKGPRTRRARAEKAVKGAGPSPANASPAKAKGRAATKGTAAAPGTAASRGTAASARPRKASAGEGRAAKPVNSVPERRKLERRRSAPELEPVPSQGYASEEDVAMGAVQPPGGTELFMSAAEIVGELAKAGISTGERLLRDALSRLPLS